MEKNFEMLSLNEQKAKLEKILDSINRIRAVSRQITNDDISDVSFYRKSDGSVCYVLTISQVDGSEEQEVYEEKFEETIEGHRKSLSEVDVNSLIEEYKNKIKQFNTLGYTTDELQAEIDELEKMKKSKEYSLSSIAQEIAQKENELNDYARILGIPENQIDYFAGINGNSQLGDLGELGIQKADMEEVEDTARDLGIQEKDVASSVTVDENGRVGLNVDSLKANGIVSNDISGTDKVTTFYSMNDILGETYTSYRIVKSSSGSFVLGISEDGTAQKIENSSLQINEAKSLSLMREDGSIRNVGVVISFYVNNPGSQFNGREVVGLYNDNGNVASYYGRKEPDGAILGKPVEEGRAVNAGREAQQQEMLDTRRNEKISGEAASASDRTRDGSSSTMYYVASFPEDRDVLIAQCAEYFGIDEDLLREAVEERTRDDHNTPDEVIVEQEAEKLAEENQEAENQEAENQETKKCENAPKAPSDDHEPVLGRGTPWGNPTGGIF